MGKTSDRAYILLAFRMVGDFGVTIAVPAVLAALAGQWLDTRWGTHPWALILCLVLAFAGTAYFLIRKAKSYAAEYQNLIDRNEHPSDRR